MRATNYSEFSTEKDGELARELVQTWICDHRLEVANCVRIALDNRKQSFSKWFRDSEQYSSPDEILLYCLGKQNNLHVSIFNSKYVWTTLSKHLRYDKLEIVEHSHIILMFLGERHYAIFRKKGDRWRNPHVPTTHPRMVGAKPAYVLAALKRLCVDHRIKMCKVSV